MKSKSPLFSIIIPTRNRSSLLKRCIQSLLAQIFDKWELIIVDDGSKDDTANVVADFSDGRIKYFYQQPQERSSARNHGIEKAKGKYVCFIDDDDYVTQNYLSDFYEYYSSYDFPQLILRTGFIRKIGAKEKHAVNYDHKKHKNPVNFVLYNMCGVGSLCVPRKALMIDKFPIQFPHWQDTHLFCRILTKFEMEQLPSHNYIYNIHSEMGSKKAIVNFDILERAELNIAAIEDLFNQNFLEIKKYIPSHTLKFLSAEKYLEYANNALPAMKIESTILMKKSLRAGFFFRLWKSYLIHIKHRLS